MTNDSSRFLLAPAADTSFEAHTSAGMLVCRDCVAMQVY